jgi:hypothetical protein
MSLRPQAEVSYRAVKEPSTNLNSGWPVVDPKSGRIIDFAEPITRREPRHPRFDPGPAYEDSLARERLRPNRYGGVSKKDLMGSVEDSWGSKTERQYGMFEVEEDPPSRPASPCQVTDRADEVCLYCMLGLLSGVSPSSRYRHSTCFCQSGTTLDRHLSVFKLKKTSGAWTK